MSAPVVPLYGSWPGEVGALTRRLVAVEVSIAATNICDGGRLAVLRERRRSLLAELGALKAAIMAGEGLAA